MPDFIAYYRVSTDRQGASGLGLEAQRAAVAVHIGTDRLLAEYTEVESGKKHTNRPQLLAALQECRRKKATLVIAKLDESGRFRGVCLVTRSKQAATSAWDHTTTEEISNIWG